MKVKAYIQPVFIIAIAAILLGLAFILPNESYVLTLLTYIMEWAVFAVSWAIFSGSTGYISLAVAAFYGVGVYAAAIIGKSLPLPLIVIIGGLVSAVLAAVVGAITLRLRGIYFTIFTFGLVQLIQQVILWIEINVNHTRGRTLLYTGNINSMVYYYILGILFVLMLTAYFLRRSRYGLALNSIGQNEEAAEHMGVNTTLFKILAFTLSSFFMGAIGAIIAVRYAYIDPYIAFNINYSFYPVIMAIFGGMGYLYGPVIGAVVFEILQDRLSENPTYYLLFFGLVMVLAITFLPKGILGLIERFTRRRGMVKGNASAGRN